MAEQTTQMYFRATDAMRAAIEQRAQAEGSTLGAIAAKLIEEGLRSPKTTEVTLDAACAVVLQHIDKDQAELILDLCLDNGHQPADYILGYLELIRDRQETATLFGREHAYDTAVAKPVMNREEFKACEFCLKEFRVERRGQKYCPDPVDGEGCGRKAFLKELHERRPQAPVKVKRGADSPRIPDYSPPQVDAVQIRSVLAQQAEMARAAAEGGER